MVTTRILTFAVLFGLGLPACFGSPSNMFAPRFPGAARAPVPREKVQVLSVGRPTCDYEVIGTVFTRGQEDLAPAAAEVGGDGVYDTQCELFQENHMIVVPTAQEIQRANGVSGGTSDNVTSFQTTHANCAGRVYVCKGSGAPKGS